MVKNEIFKITEYIKNNYQQKITIGRLATEFNISIPTLFRKFSESLNCTPMKYITEIRLAYATSLLETTELSVGEIAASVGINDQFYLSKLFKTKYGVSPTVYREKMNSKLINDSTTTAVTIL